jgi:chaperonin GroEL
METIKSKTPAKIIIPRGSKLDALKLSTLKAIADAVGGTLGPHGRPVLIERPEYGLPPYITKDGVTVFRALGFEDAVQHCIMEATRDGSVRTADEAGDGTTTCTILIEALNRLLGEFIKKNPTTSPQAAVRELQSTFDKVLVPEIKRISIKANPDSKAGLKILRAVAKVSGNGDDALADSVMAAFEGSGDDGNVTIVEESGPSCYKNEKIEGFPMAMGYEESCQRFAAQWVNRPDTQQILLDKPLFLLFHGQLNSMDSLLPILDKIFQAANQKYLTVTNLVIVATHFSDQLLGQMLQNWVTPNAINMLPVRIPMSPIQNGQRQFLDDLAAVVDGEIYDPNINPIEEATFEGLGNLGQNQDTLVWSPLGIERIEMGRYRSTILGFANAERIKTRAAEIRGQLEQAPSQLDKIWTEERLAKITGGIVRIRVQGSSNAELKERRDRVEDAVCAVRGAIKHGAIPGGGWGLLRLAHVAGYAARTPLTNEVLIPALEAPIRVLYANAGFSEDRTNYLLDQMRAAATGEDPRHVEIFDALADEFVVGAKAGLLDSAPALREALKNAISVASVMGTTGGVVCQKRDRDFERKDASEAADYQRAIEEGNPADNRP